MGHNACGLALSGFGFAKRILDGDEIMTVDSALQQEKGELLKMKVNIDRLKSKLRSKDTEAKVHS